MAQQSTGATSSTIQKGLEFREVSGMVKDSSDNPIADVVIKLISAKDSMIVTTDQEGIFFFSKVTTPVFLITASKIGCQTIVKRFLNSDANPKIVLAPFLLRDKSYQIKEVKINGRPTIIYKIDTVEYRASDYKTHEYDRVDELLKKMEGMEVGLDGSLTHNGQLVTKAKLNGREFSSGDVKKTIQNLPASIVDKIQVVDDYGDQASRTGIKTGEPAKTLNITTKADKSIGTIGQLLSKTGTDNRYVNSLSVQNINANRVLNLTGDFNRVINGVSSSTSTFSAPGTTKSVTPVFSYNDDWGNKIKVTVSYKYNYNDLTSTISEYGQKNSTRGVSVFKNLTNSENQGNNHEIKIQLDYNIDKSNYLQIIPNFIYNSSRGSGNATTNNLNYFTTSFEHPVVDIGTYANSNGNSYGLAGFFVHNFKNPARSISVQFSFNHSATNIGGDKAAAYRYFLDSTTTNLVKDSVSHLLTKKNSRRTVYSSTITYAEPVSLKSRLEFTTLIKSSQFDNRAVSDTVVANGEIKELPRLSNIYNYQFIEGMISAAYSYIAKNTQLSMGAMVVPTSLSGNEINNNNNNNVSSSRSDFRIIPVFRYAYIWSSTEKIQVNYWGNNTVPDFQQIQPFTDRSDPNNIVTGNPNLKPTFTHTISAGYNKYFANTKFNISYNLTGMFYSNQVAVNISQIAQPISPTVNTTINQINFINLSGDKTIISRYSISKQWKDRNYNLNLNGSISYGYAGAVSNNDIFHTTTWDFNERLGPRLSLNSNNFLLNPYISYDIKRSVTSTLNALPTDIQTLKLAVDGQWYFVNNLQLHYDVSKNYLSGFANYNLNPFVINFGLEKRLLRSRSLAITLDGYDLLHQNRFAQQIITPQSTTYLLSNVLSRYFMVGLKLNLQKWGGIPKHDGVPLKRRGDGSFIK